MNVDERVQAFHDLGNFLESLPDDDLQSIALKARLENPWFTEDNVRLALTGITRYLDDQKLHQWLTPYSLPVKSKKVGLVMAGNIPLVGFHDLLSVLIAGHQAIVKLSSKDTSLLSFVVNELTRIAPSFANAVAYAEQLKGFDAVIATGSDNSARYFEYYFGKYPHIIRKNRTSVAILTGNETPEEILALGKDVFSYFGLGCRNVSKLFVPAGFELVKILEGWNSYHDIIHHHKYCNNYDYQKSIMLVNKVPFLDNGFVMIQENSKLVSPISVVYYEFYADQHDLSRKLVDTADKLQCIIGTSSLANVPFGKAQFPDVRDYADQVDTMKFLCGLN